MPVQRRLLERLGGVRAPHVLQDDFESFVETLRASLPLFEDLIAVVRENRNDPELNTELARVAADTRPFATEHKLLACLPDAS